MVRPYLSFVLIFFSSYLLMADAFFSGLPENALYRAETWLELPGRYLRHKIRQRRLNDHVQQMKERYPAVKAYLQGLSALQLKADNLYRYSEGEQWMWDQKIYIDSWGARFESKEVARKLAQEKRPHQVLVMGGSISFGVSPYSHLSYTDLLNSSQKRILFTNYSRVGQGCVGLLNSLKTDEGITKKDYAAYIISTESVNNLPRICPRPTEASDDFQHFETLDRSQKNALESLKTYQGDDFANCIGQIVQSFALRHRPVFLLDTPLAYTEEEWGSPLYNTLINTGCSAEYQSRVTQIHRERLAQLARKTPGVYLVPLWEKMSGKKEYFWDSVHFSVRGHEMVAKEIAKAISSVQLPLSSLPLSCEKLKGQRPLVVMALGQSQMSNWGEKLAAASGNVYVEFAGQCYPLKDPIIGADGMGGSLWTRLTPMLSAQKKRPVLLLQITQAASKIAAWAPKSENFLRIKQKLAWAAQTGLSPDLILWQQGESDQMERTSPQIYGRNLTLIMRELQIMAPKSKIFIAQSSYCKGSSAAILAEQKKAAQSIPGIYQGPVSDFLRPSFRSDGCHFNEAGLQQLAQLWLEALKAEQE